MSDNQQFCLRWNNHQSTLVQVIDSLLSSGVLVDCTLAAEGQYLHAHKVVLCACSPYLETLLSQHYEKHPIVILKDVKFQELKSMMDYMYKGEVNISQDQLGQFLKAAESLQIKGLTDGGGGENDSKDVGSTSHKRHDPPPIRKSVPPNTSRSSVVLPSHGTGLTIEPSKRSLPSHLSESQPDSPIRSREGSSSPTPRKRRRPRRPSQGDDDGHQDNCDLPMQQQSMLNTVPIIPQLPAGSSSTITKAPPPDDEPDQPAESDVRLAESGLLKEKIEPQSELLIEPKTEYMEETNNDDSVEDLTLDDDDEYDNMDAAGPSHGGDNSNQSYGQWQMGDRTHDEVFMAAQEAVGGGPRDSQDSAVRITITRDQALRLQKLYHEKPAGQRKFTDKEIRRNAIRLKIPAVKIRYWLGKRNALADEPNPPPSTATSSAQPIDIDKPRCKLFADLSFEKKVALLRKTRTATKFSVRLTQDISREFQIPESRVHNWLRYKIYRNLHTKRSLTVQELAALNGKFVEFDYLDDDTALVLADRLNVSTSVIKRAFQRCKPLSQNVTPVIEVKKLNLPASVTITMVPKVTPDTVTPDTSAPNEPKKKKIFKVEQKNTLFEAFRESPTLTKPDKVAEIAEATGLSTMQVTKWLSVFRAKWAQSNESGLKKALTRGVNSDQLVALEKAYREDRFLTSFQLNELPKTVSMSKQPIQGWFSNRRIYEIRSNDKDLVNIGPKTVPTSTDLNHITILKPVITIPQSKVHQQSSKAQPDVESTDEFFESLSKEQKLHLKSACKNYNVSYKRLSRALGLPLDKVQHFIRSYRLQHNIFRTSNLALPERVQKTLLNHYLKFGKISTKTSVILAKRLKVRPEQIMGWNKHHTKRLLQVGGIVKSPPTIPAEPVEPIETPVEVESVENGEQESEPSAEIPAPVRKSFSQKDYGSRGSRYFASATAKAVLFEEFKKSPTAASTDIKKIAKMVKLTPMQVRKWLYNYGKSLSEQTKSKVVACLNNPQISDEARARLETEYRKCSYMEESDMENLAQQFGLTRRQVASWFINARYYEALVGRSPGDENLTRAQTPPKPKPSLPRIADDSSSSAGTSRTRRRSLPDESSSTIQLNFLNLTIKQMEILVTEFESNPNLSDERAANMAKRIKITKDRIKAWFENRRQELQLQSSDDAELAKQKIPPIKIIMPKFSNSDDQMPTIASPDSSSKKVPVQQNTLFEEFKRSSKLTSERLIKISAETNLSGKQISAWFNWLNYKLSTIPKESLSEENRNKYLSLQQIEELERYYAENRYAHRAARESLSISLDVPKSIVKSWFASRRYYEILSQNGAIEDRNSPEYTNFAEADPGQSETVIDYDWEADPAAVDPLEQKFDVQPLEVDPLLNSYCSEEPIQAEMDVNFQLSANTAFDEDLTSLPYTPRERLVTPLGDNLEPSEENVERLFWFVSKTPNTINEKYNQEIDEAKTAILDSEFGKYPWPDLDRISQLSAQLLVSEPKIHWWFIKKRCFLTKTILTLPAPTVSKPKPDPKNVLIDLTDDDHPEKPGEFEFVTLDETTQIKREEEPLNENDILQNGDPFENNVIEKSFDNEEPPYESNESTENANTTPNSSASSSVKKKKVKIPLTSHQRAILMQEYKRNKFISSSQARIVAQDLGLTVTRIENWFESMRKSAAKKKAGLTEASVSVKSLNPELESSLEAEYLKSANLSVKRAKMIALKLKTKKKTVKKWFIERAKRKDE